MTLSPQIRVVAAVIRRNGKVLLAQRAPGSHLAGMWEFPGGKVHDGESDAIALQRELQEELALRVKVQNLLGQASAEYPGKKVQIWFYQCQLSEVHSEPQLREVADFRWLNWEELGALEMPAADREFIENFQYIPCRE